MKGILIRWLILTAAIIFASYVIDGIHVKGFFSAFFAAATLGILNALLLKMASGVISGFEVYGFWSAVFGSLLISVVSWALSSFIGAQGRVEYIDLKKKGDRWE